MHRKIVICLSGGFDSSILAAMSHDRYEMHPLYFDYAQAPCKEELSAAHAVCQALELPAPVVMRLRELSASREDHYAYYPYRNLMFGVHAAAFAIKMKATAVWFGFVADTDPTRYPDATQEFCDQANRLMRTIYANQ